METPSLLPSDSGVVQELGTAVSLNILGEDFDSGNIRLDPKSNTQKKDVVYYGLLWFTIVQYCFRLFIMLEKNVCFIHHNIMIPTKSAHVIVLKSPRLLKVRAFGRMLKNLNTKRRGNRSHPSATAHRSSTWWWSCHRSRPGEAGLCHRICILCIYPLVICYIAMENHHF